MRSSLFLVWLVGSAGGCVQDHGLGVRETAPELQDDDFPDAPENPSRPEGTDPTTTLDPGDRTAVEPLVLVYAMFEQTVEERVNPSPVNNDTADAITYAVKRLVWEEGAGAYDEQLCVTWGNEVFNSTWSLVSDFATQRGILERPVAHDTGTHGAGTFTVGQFTDLLGTTVAQGPLPADADDSGVVDTDADGNPGVTVFVSHRTFGDGESYFLERVFVTLSGEWVEPTVATGSLVSVAQTVTLENSTWWLGLGNDDGTLQTDDSWFQMIEVDPAMDCAAIYDDREELGLFDRP